MSMSNVANVKVCHYVLVVDRPTHQTRQIVCAGRFTIARSYRMTSRLRSVVHRPRDYRLPSKQQMFANERGPHQGGVFYDGGGQTRGGDNDDASTHVVS